MTGAAILAAVLVLYALVARRLDRWSITAPIVFVAAGTLLGPDATGLIDLRPDEAVVRHLTEITLAVLLFADASTVPLDRVRDDARLPGRLLAIGLPLTIVLGALAAGALFPEARWAPAALVACILAPTDAALGMAVVTNTAVPTRIRRALNVESGLNDGIAAPIVALFLALTIAEEGREGGSWLAHSGAELGLALLAAVVVGGIGGRLAVAARRRGWTSALSEELAVLAFAGCAYLGSLAVGGNGFVAAFAGGLLFGRATAGEYRRAVEFTEVVATVASFLVWTIFGVLFVGPVLAGGFHGAAVVYAVLCLTVVRMVPVAIALAGGGLRRDTVAFVGWFGPRGLASVVFTLMAVEELRVAGIATDTLVEVATWTILLSVLAHGLTAGWLAGAYGVAVGRESGIPELLDVPEPRVRHRFLAR